MQFLTSTLALFALSGTSLSAAVAKPPSDACTNVNLSSLFNLQAVLPDNSVSQLRFYDYPGPRNGKLTINGPIASNASVAYAFSYANQSLTTYIPNNYISNNPANNAAVKFVQVNAKNNATKGTYTLLNAASGTCALIVKKNAITPWYLCPLANASVDEMYLAYNLTKNAIKKNSCEETTVIATTPS